MKRRRTLLLIVGSIGWLAIGLSATGQTKEEEAARKRAEAAAAAIEKLGRGVKVERDLKAPGRPVVKVSLPTCTCLPDDSHLVHLESLTELRRLELRKDCKNSHLSDKGLSHLRNLTKLEYLYVDGTEVTDAGLEHLKGLANLRELVFHETRVTDAGVKGLQKALSRATIKRERPVPPREK
jgi:hypothetical protein